MKTKEDYLRAINALSNRQGKSLSEAIIKAEYIRLKKLDANIQKLISQPMDGRNHRLIELLKSLYNP